MALLLDLCVDRLRRLAAVLDLDGNHVVSVFRKVVWPAIAQQPLGWQSDIADDHTPIELSVSVEDHRAALRVLFEPQGSAPNIAAFRLAAAALHDRLERVVGADLSRLRRVDDLFLGDGEGRFAAWSSLVFEPGGKVGCKVYLNPQAQGRACAQAVTEEALTRLGIPGAWATLCSAAVARGPYLDEVKYFALDLSAGMDARVKVYVLHHGASVTDLRRACATTKNASDGDALAFVSELCGSDGPMDARAPFTCHAFVGSSGAPTATVYIPVCAYAASDAVIADRVVRYLQRHGMEAGPYRRILAAAAGRPLDSGIGLQSWVALHPRPGAAPRIAIYLATEAGRVFPPGAVPAPSEKRTTALAEGGSGVIRELALEEHPLVSRVIRTRDSACAARVISLLQTAPAAPALAERIRARMTAALESRRDAGQGPHDGRAVPGNVDPAEVETRSELWRRLDDVYRQAFGVAE